MTGKRAFDGETAELQSLCTAITDCHHSTPNWTDAGWIVVRSENIKNGKISLNAPSYTDEASFRERIARSVPQAGDLIITREAPMGEIGMIPDGVTCCLGQRQVLIKPDPARVDKHYLLYAMQSHFVQMQIGASDATGSTVSNLRIPLLKELAIPLIGNKLTQGRIAAVLSALDAKIDLNQRINAELEALAKTIYDYWFVQFDFPDAHGRPYQSSGGAMVWNDTLKREIPVGWEVGPLGRWISFKRGISYRATEIADDGVPLINLNSFHLDGSVKLEGTKWFRGKFREEQRVNPGKLVVAITDVTRNADITGKAFVVPDLFGEMPLISCDVAVVSGGRFLPAYYLEKLFNSSEYHNYIRHFASGTLVLHLNLNGVMWFETFLPPPALVQRFCALVESMRKLVNANLKQNRELTQLRDWLLPLLLNGQVRVA